MIVIQVKSKTYGKQFIFVDGEDFDRIKDYTWAVHKNKRSKTFYAMTTLKCKSIYMHRLLMNFPKNMIDHKNRNGLDNRRENIRECTSIENSRNSSKRKIKSSKYKGVFFDKRRNKYHSKIMIEGKSKHIGFFKNENDAGKAYNEKAIELFGEFACLNIIKEK